MSLYAAVVLHCAQYLDKSRQIVSELLLNAESRYDTLTEAELSADVPYGLMPPQLTPQQLHDARDAGSRLLQKVTVGDAALSTLIQSLFDAYLKQLLGVLMQYVSMSGARRHALASHKSKSAQLASFEVAMERRCDEMRGERKQEADQRCAELQAQIARLESEIAGLRLCPPPVAHDAAPGSSDRQRSPGSPRAGSVEGTSSTPRGVGSRRRTEVSPSGRQSSPNQERRRVAAGSLHSTYAVTAEVVNARDWLTATPDGRVVVPNAFQDRVEAVAPPRMGAVKRAKKPTNLSPMQASLTTSHATDANTYAPSQIWRACTERYRQILDRGLERFHALWHRVEQGTIVSATFARADEAFGFAQYLVHAASDMTVPFRSVSESGAEQRTLRVPPGVVAAAVHGSHVPVARGTETLVVGDASHAFVAADAAELLQSALPLMVASAAVDRDSAPWWLQRLSDSCRVAHGRGAHPAIVSTVRPPAGDAALMAGFDTELLSMMDTLALPSVVAAAPAGSPAQRLTLWLTCEKKTNMDGPSGAMGPASPDTAPAVPRCQMCAAAEVAASVARAAGSLRAEGAPFEQALRERVAAAASGDGLLIPAAGYLCGISISDFRVAADKNRRVALRHAADVAYIARRVLAAAGARVQHEQSVQRRNEAGPSPTAAYKSKSSRSDVDPARCAFGVEITDEAFQADARALTLLFAFANASDAAVFAEDVATEVTRHLVWAPELNRTGSAAVGGAIELVAAITEYGRVPPAAPSMTSSQTAAHDTQDEGFFRVCETHGALPLDSANPQRELVPSVSADLRHLAVARLHTLLSVVAPSSCAATALVANDLHHGPIRQLAAKFVALRSASAGDGTAEGLAANQPASTAVCRPIASGEVAAVGTTAPSLRKSDGPPPARLPSGHVMAVAVSVDGPLWLPDVDPSAAAEVVAAFEEALAATVADVKAAVLSYDRAEGSVVFAVPSAGAAAEASAALHQRLTVWPWSQRVLRFRPFAAIVAPGAPPLKWRPALVGGGAAGQLGAPGDAANADSGEEGGSNSAGIVDPADRARCLFSGPRLKIGVGAGGDGLMPILRAVELCDAAVRGETLCCSGALGLFSNHPSIATAPLPEATVIRLGAEGRPLLTATRNSVARLYGSNLMRQRERVPPLGEGDAPIGQRAGVGLLLRKLRAQAVASGDLTRAEVDVANRALDRARASKLCGAEWRRVSAAEAAVCLDRLRRGEWAPGELLLGALTQTCDVPGCGPHMCLPTAHLAAAASRAPRAASPSRRSGRSPQRGAGAKDLVAGRRPPAGPLPTAPAEPSACCPLVLLATCSTSHGSEVVTARAGALSWLPPIRHPVFKLTRVTAPSSQPSVPGSQKLGGASSLLPKMSLSYSRYVALRDKFEGLARQFNARRTLVGEAHTDDEGAADPADRVLRRLVPLVGLRELHTDVASELSAGMPPALPEGATNNVLWPSWKSAEGITDDGTTLLLDATTDAPVVGSKASAMPRDLATAPPTVLYSFQDVLDLYFPGTAPLTFEAFDVDYRAGVKAASAELPDPEALATMRRSARDRSPPREAPQHQHGALCGGGDERKVLELRRKLFAAVAEGEVVSRHYLRELWLEKFRAIRSQREALFNAFAAVKERDDLVDKVSALSKRNAILQQDNTKLKASTHEMTKLRDRLKNERRDAASSETELARALGKLHFASHAVGAISSAALAIPDGGRGSAGVISDAQVHEDWLGMLDSIQSDSLNPFAPVPRVATRRVTVEAGQRARNKYASTKAVLLMPPGDTTDNTSPEKMVLSAACAMFTVYEEARARVAALTEERKSASADSDAVIEELRQQLAEARRLSRTDSAPGGSSTNPATGQPRLRRHGSSSPAARGLTAPGETAPLSPLSPELDSKGAVPPAAGRFALAPAPGAQPHALDSRPQSAATARGRSISPGGGTRRAHTAASNTSAVLGELANADDCADFDDLQVDEAGNRRVPRRIVFNVVLGDRRSSEVEAEPEKFEAGTESCDACSSGVAYVSCPGCWGAKLCVRCCHALHDILPEGLLRRAAHVVPQSDGGTGRYGGHVLEVVRLGGTHLRVRAPGMVGAAGSGGGASCHLDTTNAAARHARHLHFISRAQAGAAPSDAPRVSEGGLDGLLTLGTLPNAPATLTPRDQLPSSTLATHVPGGSAKPSQRPASAASTRGSSAPSSEPKRTAQRHKKSVASAEQALARALAAGTGAPQTAARSSRDKRL